MSPAYPIREPDRAAQAEICPGGSRPDSRLVRDSEQPLYRQLAGLLEQQIDTGEFAAGARLPSEPELMAAHGVSRITVRQAVALLVQDGRVVARRGKGTFVASPVMRHDLGALRGFYDALRQQGLAPQTELLSFSPGPDPDAPVQRGRRKGEPPGTVPQGLGLPVRLRRRYSLEGKPFAVVEAWLPAQVSALGEAAAARMTVYQIVERFLGKRVASADVAIRCQPASRGIAAELGLATGSVVLVMERRSLSQTGQVLEFMRIHIVPERYEFHLSVPGALEIASGVRRTASEPPVQALRGA
jgi:GntR family transcriptional regulator